MGNLLLLSLLTNGVVDTVGKFVDNFTLVLLIQLVLLELQISY
jgi:hypothetical protein